MATARARDDDDLDQGGDTSGTNGSMQDLLWRQSDSSR